jgi:hypothetical protein
VRCAACNQDHPLAPGARVGFRDTCESCDADLHSCVNCAHYDPGAQNDCREPSAEHVSGRDRANHCEWFQAGDREGGSGGERSQAIDDLAALFKK